MVQAKARPERGHGCCQRERTSSEQSVEARHEITELLMAWRQGDRDAFDRLLPLVYDEMRRIAHGYLAGERPDHTLRTTALVHEAYLKLVDTSRVQWRDGGHFLAAAAGTMRRILVDYARRYRSARRGGGQPPATFDENQIVIEDRAEMLIALDDALVRLAATDERLCRVVECRYFGGLSDAETAHALGVTSRTVRRDWVKARGWLYEELIR
jgi:RNA polymerase sigma factor (TIGR02999 family)